MKRQGLSVDELVIRTKKNEERERKEKLIQRAQLDEITTTAARGYASANITEDDVRAPSVSAPKIASNVRKDSSPVKPLSSILNFERLFTKPHTPEQISTLWNAYHASRSGGTGRGYLSATIPLEKYEKMVSVAKPYSKFILPLPREDAQVSEDSKPEGAVKTPTEFFYMQWDFHGSPPDPTASNDLFARPISSGLPQTSTILFTPLVEFQTHNSFATPHLVITHYTDLAKTHNVVLLRGEITPSNGQAGSKETTYHLAQHHAQALALGVQQFYLWTGQNNEREELVKIFHERPQDFKWEDVLKLSEPTL